MHRSDDHHPNTIPYIQGYKKIGKDEVDAVLAELKQIHDRMVIYPRDPTKMTKEEKHAALQYLMFLKKKRCGRIKGRGCADGRKQRLTMNKNEVSASTVATEALVITCVIDAMEHRDVATFDKPGEFMKTDMEGEDVNIYESEPIRSSICNSTLLARDGQ